MGVRSRSTLLHGSFEELTGCSREPPNLRANHKAWAVTEATTLQAGEGGGVKPS
jgi:hypothetical protein